MYAENHAFLSSNLTLSHPPPSLPKTKSVKDEQLGVGGEACWVFLVHVDSLHAYMPTTLLNALLNVVRIKPSWMTCLHVVTI